MARTLSTVVLSVRIRKELKERAKALRIDIRSVVEKALEEEIRRIEAERLKSLLNEALESMRNIGVDEWVSAVRESRESRRS